MTQPISIFRQVNPVAVQAPESPIEKSLSPSRQPMSIFVQRASQCLTDHLPHGDGLICYSLLSGLARRGHRIFAFTDRNEVRDRPPHLQIKARAHRIKANSLADFEQSWFADRWLKQLEKQHKIDLVWRMLPQGSSCPTVPYTGGRPLVVGQLFYTWPIDAAGPTSSGTPRFGFGIGTWVRPLADRGWAKTLRAASLVIGSTEPLSNQLRQKTDGITTTVPVIVDVPGELVTDRSRPISPPKLKLLFVANLVPNKNPLIFCQTICLLRQRGIDAMGQVLGDGPLRGELETFCVTNAMQNSVQFLGQISNAEVYRHLSEADGLISTSVGEPYGRSIVEAMSVSAVPICHRSGGPADILRHGEEGLLIDSLDAADYANAILHYIGQPGAWQKLASAAWHKSQQWRSAVILDQLEAALYSLVESR